MYLNKFIVLLLFSLIVVYNLLDFYQTKMLIDLGAYEANPILQKLIELTGSIDSILYIKSFFLWILACGLFQLNNQKGEKCI